MLPNDLVLEDIIASEYGESKHTWRNRRLAGEGPPYYKKPGKRSRVFYSRSETRQYYLLFRRVPARTAKLMQDLPAA